MVIRVTLVSWLGEDKKDFLLFVDEGGIIFP